jgi:CheY-like chemotaxis protein/HPt (histidine-containing phosphotransfer) domain-containing protein
VLVVDDNAVNQKLLVYLLAQEGYSPVTADNGRQAVEQIQAQPFALVLMDVQMPHMDGLEATAAVRAWERGRGGHVPIIAVTTNDLPGDRAKCLAAGMDEYVCKPVRRDALLQAMRTALKEASVAAPPAPKPAQLDVTVLVERVGGDRAVVADLAQIFFEESPQTLAALRAALTAGDAGKVKLHAHTLRGSASFFGAEEVVEAARQLETMGRSAALAGAEAIFAELDAALGSFAEALRTELGSETCSKR